MLYRAKVIDKNNTVLKISEEHPTKDEYITSLLKRDYNIISVRRSNILLSLNPFAKKVSKENFFSELYELLSSGLTLQKALQIIANNSSTPEIHLSIVEKIKGGGKFSDAAAELNIFSPSDIALIRTGEDSGEFIEVIRIISEYTKHMAQLKKKVMAMIYYPILLLILFSVITVYVVTAVLPKILLLFDELNIEQPPLTRFFIGIISFTGNNAVLAVLGTIIVVVLLYLIVKNLKYSILKLLLYVPLISTIIKNHLLFSFLHPFSLMLKKGLYIKTIISSLKKSFEVNEILADFLAEIDSRINKGARLSDAFSASNIFNGRQKELIRIAEETSNFPRIVDYIKENNDIEYENNLKSLITVIEPFIIILIGALVLFFVIVFILPIITIDVGF
ncbi:type II secretion system F family protein [Spirochaetota bacterium]